MTQPQISELLQIGEKTWTRWETGRERPSRSINVLLFALNDGKLDAAYLRSVARRRNDWASQAAGMAQSAENPWQTMVEAMWQGWEPEAGLELAEAVQEAIAGFLVSRGEQGDFGFRVEGMVTVEASAPANVIPVRMMRGTGSQVQTVGAAEASVCGGPRFEIPETLVA